MEEGNIYLLPNIYIILCGIINIIDTDTIIQYCLSVPVQLYLFSVQELTIRYLFIPLKMTIPQISSSP